MYHTIVIGAGIAGAVAARRLAEKGGRRVLVLEQRNHIGGNCYDKDDPYGVLIHEYGPHIFHTNDEGVYEYLSRFTDWYLYPQGHQVVANVEGELIPIPFNLNTLHLVYEEEKARELEEKLISAYGEGSRVPIMELKKSADPDIQQIAQYVYENIFLRYTMKQWGQKPEEISPEVTGRVPVLISYDNRYFQDKYQGVPLKGFTPMFERLLDHENIEVQLGVKASDRLSISPEGILFDGSPFDGEVIFTGALDELFDCRYGRLPYRSLRFDFAHLDQEDFQQGHSVVNYTVSEDFTRITEFQYLTGQTGCKGTTIVREYPFAYRGAEGEIPYYAILNADNEALYEKYRALTAGLSDFYLLGRLAEYKYYNMDAMARKALDLAERIMEKKR
ncbi:MAG: UDP-galactopyranose mutase [bacterium]|nr:UDP-galactopyranose mutase [bacterium]MDY4099179.1 UDP-galactopyranose mutase [Lachnospiraceae bacterium]